MLLLRVDFLSSQNSITSTSLLPESLSHEHTLSRKPQTSRQLPTVFANPSVNFTQSSFSHRVMRLCDFPVSPLTTYLYQALTLPFRRFVHPCPHFFPCLLEQPSSNVLPTSKNPIFDWKMRTGFPWMEPYSSKERTKRRRLCIVDSHTSVKTPRNL